MTRFHKNLLRTAFFISLIFISIANLYAEKITDRDFGFSLDLPEGFEVSYYADDGMSYVFSHPNIPVTFLMKLAAEPQAKGAERTVP